MNKQTKMLLGIGAVAVVGYLIWKQGQKPTISKQEVKHQKASAETN